MPRPKSVYACFLPRNSCGAPSGPEVCMPAAPLQRSRRERHCPLEGANSTGGAALHNTDICLPARARYGTVSGGKRTGNTAPRWIRKCNPAARCARGFARNLAALDSQRSQGMPYALCSRGLMRNVHRKCAHEHTGQRRTSDIPCAMALRPITCSPRRTALLPPLRPGKLLPPGALTPAPRRQDHTSSPYATHAFVIGTTSVHRDPPHVRDDHDTPLLSGRDGNRYATVRPSGKAKYFLFWGLTRFRTIGSDLPV